MDSLILLVWLIAATLVAVPLVLTVLRPLARAHLAGRTEPLRSPGGAPGDDVRPQPGTPTSAVEEAGIDTARAEVGIQASALKKLREHVDAHPDEACAVLRSWLHAA